MGLLHAKIFPYYSEAQIKRIINSLVKKGVIIKECFNRHLYDRTTWYAFKDEEHFISYDDMKYAVDKTEWFLKNHEERESIAKRGHDLVRSKHTYMDRVIQMLDICEYDGT